MVTLSLYIYNTHIANRHVEQRRRACGHVCRVMCGRSVVDVD